MDPETRFHQIVVGLTIIVMFISIKAAYSHELLSIVLPEYFQNVVIEGSLWLVGSAAVYSSISRGLMVPIRRIQRVRRFLLGPAFIEGTWVGWFKGHSGRTRYLVEIYEQDLSHIRMRGYAYASDGREHSVWCTRSTNLDVKRGTFSYTYSVSVVDDPKVRDGVCEYHFFRTHEHCVPKEMAGYTSDLDHPLRLHISEFKVSNKGLLKSEARAELVRLVKEGKIPGEGCFAQLGNDIVESRSKFEAERAHRI
jgi:hypothetical protein